MLISSLEINSNLIVFRYNITLLGSYISLLRKSMVFGITHNYEENTDVAKLVEKLQLGPLQIETALGIDNSREMTLQQ